MSPSSVTGYRVLRTRPDVQLTKQNKPVNGVSVTVYLPEFDEEHDVFAPSMDEKIVKASIDEFVKQRQAIASLGT